MTQSPESVISHVQKVRDVSMECRNFSSGTAHPNGCLLPGDYIDYIDYIPFSASLMIFASSVLTSEIHPPLPNGLQVKRSYSPSFTTWPWSEVNPKTNPDVRSHESGSSTNPLMQQTLPSNTSSQSNSCLCTCRHCSPETRTSQFAGISDTRIISHLFHIFPLSPNERKWVVSSRKKPVSPSIPSHITCLPMTWVGLCLRSSKTSKDNLRQSKRRSQHSLKSPGVAEQHELTMIWDLLGFFENLEQPHPCWFVIIFLG